MFDPGTIQRLQKDLTNRMEKMRAELDKKTVEGTSGGGVVTVTSTGNSEIVAVKIKAEAIDPSDPELLQDLILAAVNQALEKAKKLNEDSVSEITDGVRLPGFF